MIILRRMSTLLEVKSMVEKTKVVLRENAVALVSFGIAAALALYILLVLPPDREVKSLGIFLFKLLPFIFASLAIATVQRAWLIRWQMHYLLVAAAFLGFFCYLVPKIIFHRQEFAELYYVLLVTTPYVILALVLSFRMGGGASGPTFRLAIALLLLMVSGLEDLAFFTVNYDPSWYPLPEVWDWVTHIAVRIGHPPTRNEIVVFAIVHVLLALFVLYFPFERYVKIPWGTRKNASQLSAESTD